MRIQQGNIAKTLKILPGTRLELLRGFAHFPTSSVNHSSCWNEETEQEKYLSHNKVANRLPYQDKDDLWADSWDSPLDLLNLKFLQTRLQESI